MARLEDFIQFKCCEYLRSEGIPHFHVPNAAVRTGRQMAQLKAMGFVAGVHDLIIFINAPFIDLVEIKTMKGKLSDAQERWHEKIIKRGYHHQCHSIQSDDWQVAVAELKKLVQARLQNHSQ